MDELPIVNREINTDSTIEEMLLYHNLGMEINGLTSMEMNALEGQKEEETEKDVYELLKIKDLIISTLKQTNMTLTNLIFNFDDKISNINKTTNTLLSNISTRDDIKTVMNNNKQLVTQLSKEREYRRTIETERDGYKKDLNLLKNTYNSLNKIYVSNFQNTTPFEYQLENLKSEVQNLKSIKDELDELKDSFKCKICYSNNIDCILEPCSHIVSCKQCIDHMRDISQTGDINCPVCNAAVFDYKKIYLPL